MKYSPLAGDKLTREEVLIIVDEIAQNEVLFRRWVGETFTGFNRFPVTDFAAQAKMVKAKLERQPAVSHFTPA